MRVPIRLNWRTVAISKGTSGRLTAINKKEDTTMRTTAATNANDTTNDLATLTAFRAKLAIAIAPYGNGAGLPDDHPLHALKALHTEMGHDIDTMKADPRYNDGEMSVRPNRRDDRFNNSEERKGDALGPHMGDSSRSEPLDGDLVKRAFEAAIQKRAEARALVSGRSVEREFVDLLDERREFNKAFSSDRDPGAAESPAQDAAWRCIEQAADSLIEKSSKPLSREKAIDKVLKSRLDLSRAYYGVVDPLGDRVR